MRIMFQNMRYMFDNVYFQQYRWYVVSNLRGLKNLDFSCITKADKATAFNIKIPPIKKVKKKTEEAES